MSTAVRSHAKINLGLYIGAPRPDGFHALSTVYQTLEMHDIVTVTACFAQTTSIHLTSNDARVPTDSRNTAWKMVSLALEKLGVTADVEIHIEKRLPVQGGLGAGSANAVAALIGLEKELGLANKELDTTDKKELDITDKMGAPGLASETWESKTPIQNWLGRRLEIAAEVGSDVPLFLIGGTVLGLDRGQQVYPLPDLDPAWCVIALPPTGVSTPQAFRDWDELCAKEGLTQEASAYKLNELSRAYASAFSGSIPRDRQGAGSSGVLSNAEDLAARPQETKYVSGLVRTGITSWIENDFERVVFPQHPSLAEIKRILAGPADPEAASHPSCLLASLSGSGSALFGLYPTQGAAEAAAKRVRQVEGVEARITRTLPRAEYWRAMLEKGLQQ